MFKTASEGFDARALIIGFFIQAPMIAQERPVNGVILPLKKSAIQGADESAVILNSEGPAIE